MTTMEFMEVGLEGLCSKDDVPPPTDARDLDGYGASTGRRQVKPDLTSAFNGLGPAKTLNRFECHQ